MWIKWAGIIHNLACWLARKNNHFSLYFPFIFSHYNHHFDLRKSTGKGNSENGKIIQPALLGLIPGSYFNHLHWVTPRQVFYCSSLGYHFSSKDVASVSAVHHIYLLPNIFSLYICSSKRISTKAKNKFSLSSCIENAKSIFRKGKYWEKLPK